MTPLLSLFILFFEGSFTNNEVFVDNNNESDSLKSKIRYNLLY